MKPYPENRFIRYPGGKQRLLPFIIPRLPRAEDIKGTFVEPFVGGGSVFFAISPRKAILSDINPALIELYKGLKSFPERVWKYFNGFPSTKDGYYEVRDFPKNGSLAYRAARILYLNRTCFKGMWRENSSGCFNVGYGGQDRRWVVSPEALLSISKALKNAKLKINDFEEVIKSCVKGDFIFLDPPYKPGSRELNHSHYVYSKFRFDNYERLADSLKEAAKKSVKWAITISDHNDIINLFSEYNIIPFVKGTGGKPGLMSNNSGEVLICNY